MSQVDVFWEPPVQLRSLGRLPPEASGAEESGARGAEGVWRG